MFEDLSLKKLEEKQEKGGQRLKRSRKSKEEKI